MEFGRHIGKCDKSNKSKISNSFEAATVVDMWRHRRHMSVFQEELDAERAEIEEFNASEKPEALVFSPTLTKYERLQLHQFVEDGFGDEMVSFSVGEGEERRLVVGWKEDFDSVDFEDVDEMKDYLGASVELVESSAVVPSAKDFCYYDRVPAKPECVTEVYDFPSSLKTADLKNELNDRWKLRNKYELLWVDDTHAIANFCAELVLVVQRGPIQFVFQVHHRNII